MARRMIFFCTTGFKRLRLSKDLWRLLEAKPNLPDEQIAFRSPKSVATHQGADHSPSRLEYRQEKVQQVGHVAIGYLPAMPV